MNQDSDNAGDLDAELARLLAENHEAERMEVRLHVRTCPHCLAVATMIANLRRDIWSLHERRAA